MTPQERYEAVVAALLEEPDVTPPGGGGQSKGSFGADSLRVRGKIFAMLTGDRLVVKLPAKRVDALIADSEGQRFDPGHGRLMKEWLSLDPRSTQDWLALAQEALRFVRSKN